MIDVSEARFGGLDATWTIEARCKLYHRAGHGDGLTRGCNGRCRRFAPIGADEPQGR
jgi:hypothetical protein